MNHKLGIVCDHGGIDLKAKIIANPSLTLKATFVDFGCSSTDGSVDYPDFAARLAKEIQDGTVSTGIAICGTGIGMCISANKFSGIRAASIWDTFTANMAKEHNNANVICLGARVLNHDRACDLISIWLNTSFAGDRHQRRLDKISSLER